MPPIAPQPPAAGRHPTTGSPPGVARPAAFVLAAALVAGACGGCGWSICSNVQFSPDGRTVAFCRDSGAFMGFTVGPTPYGLGKDSVTVCWCTANAPKRKRSVRIDSRGPFFPPKRPQEVVKAYRFSPDSRHLAIRTEQRVVVAELASGRSWTLDTGDELPHTVLWLDNDEVAYATTVKFTDPPRAELRIFRQKIDAPPDDRTEVYRGDFDIAVGRLFWAPNGRYVLFQPTYHGGCRLLDVGTGKDWTFGTGAIKLHACAWKSDASAAFCVVTYTPEAAADRTEPPRQILLLIEPATARRTQLSEQSRRLALALPGAQWLPDGRLVLIDDGWAGAWLVQPEPWHAIGLKDRLVAALQAHGKKITSWQALQPYPVAGWLLLQDHDGRSFVVNPQRQTCTPLSETSSWAHSPDGQRIAEVDNKANVTLRALDLAPTPFAARRPATRPAALQTKHPTTRPARTE